MPCLGLSFGPLILANGWYLIGLSAALIPLILHLSRSRRTKKMRFSTTRFFTDQFLRSYRMSRLKELLLLACRMALFALFALALTEPLFVARGAPALVGDGPRTVVIVLDNSASMGYKEDKVTLLKRAQDAAGEVLAGLRPGDKAALVLAARRASGPATPFSEPTDQVQDVKSAVQGIKLSTLATDLPGAIVQAEGLIRREDESRKEIHVFSDLQGRRWEQLEAGTRRAGSPDLNYFFVRIQPRKPIVHRAVTALQYSSSRPMVGVPFAIRPIVSIVGGPEDEDRERIKVKLVVDGEEASEQVVERLQNGRWAAPRLYHTFKKGGWHEGYAEVVVERRRENSTEYVKVEDATLPGDRRRSFALEVLDQVKVLAVNGATARQADAPDKGDGPADSGKQIVPAHLDDLYYLKAALGVAREGQESPWSLRDVSVPELSGARLDDYRIVILANVEVLSPASVEKLENFVAGGGSLLVFLGGKVDPAFYNETLSGPARRNGGLLPARLERIEGSEAAQSDIAFIGRVAYGHPALSLFAEKKYAALLGPSVTFKALWKVQAPSAAVLMEASTGDPLLCEKTYGKGRVLLFTSTCDRSWTNFPIRPGILPWTYRVMAYLAQRPLGQRAFYHTGSVVRLPVSGKELPDRLQVEKPKLGEGQERTAGLAARSPGEGSFYVFGDTPLPGVYTVRRTDREEVLGKFAVNLEREESDLRYYDNVLAEEARADGAGRTASVEAGLKAWLDRPAVTYVEDPARMPEAVGGARRGYRLWYALIWMVLLVGLFEPWLANRISARLYARPQKTPDVRNPLAFAPTGLTSSPKSQPVEATAR